MTKFEFVFLDCGVELFDDVFVEVDGLSEEVLEPLCVLGRRGRVVVDVLVVVVFHGEGFFVLVEGGDVGIAKGEDGHSSLKRERRWETNGSVRCVCVCESKVSNE